MVILRSSGSGQPASSHFKLTNLTGLLVISLILCSSLAAAVDLRARSLSHLKRTHLVSDEETHENSTKAGKLQRFFEVARPVKSRRHPVCSIQLMYHEFAATYGVDPPVARYIPSKECGKRWNKVVLKWSAVCRGRQFDRIAGVWLGGVEILRTCTAEPTSQGIIWEVEKDVTRYSALWKRPQELVVAMGNVVDETYTGIFNVTVSVEFYREGGHISEELLSDVHSKSIEKHLGEPAQIILPISEPSYLGGGYWFQLTGQGESKKASLKIPRNTCRAVLEVCLSPHQNDEFWYTNPPNEYIKANNLTLAGNGAFREVLVSVDGKVVGAVWPLPILYTGGVNPLFWRPVAAIGAFDLPSYDIDITPFVGTLLDGRNHTFSMSVTDNLDMWLLQANLHIWVDPSRRSTSGSLEAFSVPSFSPGVKSDFKGLDGSVNTTAFRSLAFVGHVASSFGNLTTSTSYNLKFYNGQVMANGFDSQTVTQNTETDTTVTVKTAEKEIAMHHLASSYPLFLDYSQVENSDGSYSINCSIVHSVITEQQSIAGRSSSFSSLTNKQSSDGVLYISVNNTISGVGATQQSYSYQGTDGCYRREVSVKNYTTIFDSSSANCSPQSSY